MSEQEDRIAVVRKQADHIEVFAGSLMVATKQDADNAMARLNDAKVVRKAVVEYWKATKEAAHTAWKNIVAKETAMVDVIDRAEVVIKRKVGAWQAEEQAKAQAEQRRLQALADEQARKDRERLEKEAAKLKTPELREERLAQAAAVAAPVIQVDAAKVEGAVQVKRWKAEVINMDALIVAAVPGSVAASMLGFNQTVADTFARSTNGKVVVAGVRFFEDVGISTRSTKGGVA
jgi:hypothetical protein